MGIIKQLHSQMKELRIQWREIRKSRLKRKDELLSKGLTSKDIRKDRLYKDLKKKQSHQSKVMRHMEKKINRKNSKISEQNK